jgi:FAD:protein FMN transferase
MRAAVLITALPVLLAGTALAESEPSRDRVMHRSDTAMGTRITLTVWGDDEALAARGAEAVFTEFERVDRLMTSWGGDSDVARINAAAGTAPVEVSAETIAVIERAQQTARASSGAFDITVGAFRGLWKFDQDRDGTIPARADVLERKKLVGYKNVLIDRKAGTVKLRRKSMRITLGGIAKGYAVDRAVALLHDLGLVDFILQAGGDLYVSGKRGSRNWMVGIRDPRGAPDAPFAIAGIEDRTFSTSGDYERSVVEDGKRYHHILDPRTGYPADKARSVTVMARDALTADAWSTALFVIGPDRGLKLVESMPDLEAVFVTADNEVLVSSGLEGTLKVLKPPTPGI